MYVICRLQKMCDLLGTESIDGELATYFLKNLNSLSSMTYSKCMKDTGISKASIHRFYSRGGFDSFKEFVTALSRDKKDLHYFHYSEKDYEDQIFNYFKKCHFKSEQLILLADKLKKAKRVYFYGQQKEIDTMQNLLMYIRNYHYMYCSLIIWNMDLIHQRLEELQKDDLLIIIDTSMTVQNMYEMSINHHHLINLDHIKSYDFQKFYIGKANCDEYMGYHNVRIPNLREDMMKIGLEMLDRRLIYMLKED